MKFSYRPIPRYIKSTNPLQEVFGFLGDPAGGVGRVHANGLKQLVLIVAVEGRLSDEHLEQQHPERPPVHRERVLLSQQDLMEEAITK